MEKSVSDLFYRVIDWAGRQPHISGLALVGSYARGTASSDSDINLVFLCRSPDTFVRDPGWIQRFGVVERCHREEWGRVTSLRVHYTQGMEVEFGFTTPAWAALPVDQGTRGVVADGLRILWDPDGVLERLLRAIGAW
jgi:Streptomycin adenylyltransferase